MKVFRVTVSETTPECGVVFDIEGEQNDRSARAIVTLPDEIRMTVLAAAQAALDAAITEIPAHGDKSDLSGELHRVRSLKQDKERSRAEESRKEADAATRLANIEASIAQRRIELEAMVESASRGPKP